MKFAIGEESEAVLKNNKLKGNIPIDKNSCSFAKPINDCKRDFSPLISTSCLLAITKIILTAKKDNQKLTVIAANGSRIKTANKASARTDDDA